MGFELSGDQIEQYFESGYLGPFKLEEERDFKTHITHEVLPSDGPWTAEELPAILHDGHPDGANTLDRHLDCSVVTDICKDPAIVDRLVSLYGDDLLLLFSQFIKKPPGGKAVGWHQDRGFFGLIPSVCPTIWVAIDEVTQENGCLELAPGTNSLLFPHEEAERDETWFDYEVDSRYVDSSVDEDELVTIEMDPGEFVIFSNTTLHRSSPNTSHKHRLGLQIRVTVPYTHLSRPKRPAPTTVRLNGHNRCGIHDTVAAPERCSHSQ